MRINEIQMSNTEYKTKIQIDLDDLEKEKVRLQAEYTRVYNTRVATDWSLADDHGEDKLKLNKQMHDINQQLIQLHDTIQKVMAQHPVKAGVLLKTIEQECSTIRNLNKKPKSFC